jgi:hypothetical protein
LAYQPPASSAFLSQQISHQQSANSTLLSEQTSTSHQPPANRTGCLSFQVLLLQPGLSHFVQKDRISFSFAPLFLSFVKGNASEAFGRERSWLVE